MSDIAEIQKAIVDFRDARNWAQFHTPKDLAICLSVEASELLECFLWKESKDANHEKISAELADVFYSAFLLAHQFGFDVKGIVMKKLEENGRKYPVDKATGSNKKYDEL